MLRAYEHTIARLQSYADRQQLPLIEVIERAAWVLINTEQQLPIQHADLVLDPSAPRWPDFTKPNTIKDVLTDPRK